MNGISGIRPQSFQPMPSAGGDPYEKNIQEQIKAKQKQLQDMAREERMSPEEKMKKRQELQKEIAALNAELRQYQMEQRRSNAEEKGTPMEELLGGSRWREKVTEKGQGFSAESMKSLISADSSLKVADVQDSVKISMEGKARSLATEIKLDKSRGADTEKKEEELKDLESGVEELNASELETLSGARKEMESAREQDGKQAEEEDKQEESIEDTETGSFSSALSSLVSDKIDTVR